MQHANEDGTAPAGPEGDRRAFLERAGRASLVAPAAALLFAATPRSALAAPYGRPVRPPRPPKQRGGRDRD